MAKSKIRSYDITVTMKDGTTHDLTGREAENFYIEFDRYRLCKENARGIWTMKDKERHLILFENVTDVVRSEISVEEVDNPGACKDVEICL